MADDAPTTDEVAVLVPAAGRGTRLGGVRKQFRRLGDAPVLVQTLRAFDRHPDVQHLVVAAPPGEARATGDELHDAGLRKLTAVVPGGSSRQASVAHALRAVPSSVAVVLVHDAVRPFLAPGRIAAVVAAVRAQGAAALAVPVADTLRAADADGRFGATVPREGLYRMQTPQGFRRAWLEAAHATADGPPATDDVALVQACGHAVHLVPGDPRNVKLTTSGDWAQAQRLWPTWHAHHASEARS